jgi:hypothetical protein
LPCPLACDDLPFHGRISLPCCRRFLWRPAALLTAHCTYPLTGVGCVDWIYTVFAVFDIDAGGVTVPETFGITMEAMEQRLELTLSRNGS